jgi:cytochrome P450
VWVLTRYVDVLTALREPRLTANGARNAGHSNFRALASADAAEMLRGGLESEKALAHSMAAGLPTNRPVDLVSELVKPWSIQIACQLTRPTGDPEGMAARAADIFAAAAEPCKPTLQARAEESTLELAGAFSGELAGFRVQAFVALSQTLPCFLANAWLALLHDPEKAEMLRADPGLMPAAIEELLRHSGPSRAQFRSATGRVIIGGATIEKGDRVALMLAVANRDPEQFDEPDRLDFRRGLTRHLALGHGEHSCIGAALVRAAAAAATAAFIEYFAGARLDGPVQWHGGFAIYGPASLPVSRL